ncbi:hypothetical protein [Rhodococcus opacus]|uniref:Uncharacterized protein n=1 Tax=Rhodococcus opacus TaxID=37919 RepID=A0A2S8IW51_RHOOP|nr:hypothetical protein [Rhodococcus opacus]PQP19007.1 hypothetical protein C5613_31390 [Rhodococcus opacus]
MMQMFEEVTDHQKVELLLSVTALSTGEVAETLGCSEQALLAGDLTADQQHRFVEISGVFNDRSTAHATYFGTPGENDAYTELRLLKVLVAAGPECVMLRGSANASQRKALLVSLEEIGNPSGAQD